MIFATSRIHLAIIFILATKALCSETVGQAARLARDLISAQSIGTLASLYPPNSTEESVAGHPFALMEYYAPCHLNGSLSFILMGISQNARNIQAHSAHAAGFAIQAPISRSPVSKPRVSLTGSITFLENGTDETLNMEECYLDRHPDSKWWLPGKSTFHDASWARFDPSSVYYVGGFGGEHYIGLIPLDLYRSAGREALDGISKPYQPPVMLMNEIHE